MRYSEEILLEPFDFGNPVQVDRIYQYLVKFKADRLPWYANVSVMDHIANVAGFSLEIANKISENGHKIDQSKVFLMAWLRDIGRVPWGIAVENNFTEITEKYGHHGYLGYKLLVQSGVIEELAIISMTHIGSGVSKEEIREINKILGKTIFPEQDWYAKTDEEKIVVIADKIPGWNNTIVAHYEANQRGETTNNKIYSWFEDQTPLWKRFWEFKARIDELCGCDVLSLFDQGLLSSDEGSYKKLTKAEEIVERFKRS